MTRWAHVIDGTVDNVVAWDGQVYDPATQQGWTPPTDGELVPLTDTPDALAPVGAGWTWDGKTFTAPAPAPAPALAPAAPTVDDLLAQAQKAGATTAAKLTAIIAAVQTLADS